MTPKFTDQDRKLIIEELERIQNVKLEQVKPSRKLYKDANGMFYLISGGAEDWHGINANIMQSLAAHNQEGEFVVVKKYKTKSVKLKGTNREVDETTFEREIDFYLIENNNQYKCEVKLMGKGNPESADAVIARDSRIFIADKLSDMNKRQLNSLKVDWVEL